MEHDHPAFSPWTFSFAFFSRLCFCFLSFSIWDSTVGSSDRRLVVISFINIEGFIFFVKQSLRFKTSAICFRKSPLPSSLKCSRREPISEARRLFRCVNFVEVTVLTVDWPSDNDTVLVCGRRAQWHQGHRNTPSPREFEVGQARTRRC